MLRLLRMLLCLLLVAPLLASGPAGATALAACPEPAQPKRQLRGLWIASVSNINWPSRSGLSVAQQQDEYRRLLDRAKQLRFNAVFVQVRPASDAFYPSTLEPWSQYLTGTQGQSPGYDPLAFLVAEAHARDLEFHGWFNPYRVSTQPDPAKLAPSHPARVHPDWVIRYGNGLVYNPGLPAVRAHVREVISDVLGRYDLDGVHFDDYFYPYPVAGQEFPDEATYRQHGADFPVKADWRRDNVNRLIREVGEQIGARKPWVSFGVSPFGVWRDKRHDPTGSETTAGVHNYDDLYADTRTWIRNAWIDYVAPQVYWSIGYPPAAYDKLIPWWAKEVEGTGVSLYIGQGAYKIGTSNPAAWTDPEEMPKHLALNRSHPQVGGDIYYNVNSVFANPLGFADRLNADQHRHPALVPVRGTVPGTPPGAPAGVRAEPNPGGGYKLSWQATAGASAFAVYRLPGHQSVTECSTADPATLLGTTREKSLLDAGAPTDRRFTYLVTALDRTHRESTPRPVWVPAFWEF
ncbi:family 10 glycosylhydrolase [Crossiella sp. CA-258035]|uniref:glycoside hydrolase family 10 protein n=1 Tax=Crossiella sp. CA-258035 TaxID=2981138 RepID=UPI0024BC9232|nr:family 10 glycosylhydrolase [Crossiella sp. CA-258035]WHT20711.1 family 10 glycosylhydrolase [Crossiella sp. CA-258035]